MGNSRANVSKGLGLHRSFAMIIDKELESAYQQAEYSVPKANIRLKVGMHNEDLDTFLLDNQSDQFCIITAYNPFGIQTEKKNNEQQSSALESDVVNAGYRYFPAENVDPTGSWPIERAFILLDLSKKAGIALALKYKQLALVAGSFGQASELVWTGLRRQSRNREQ